MESIQSRRPNFIAFNIEPQDISSESEHQIRPVLEKKKSFKSVNKPKGISYIVQSVLKDSLKAPESNKVRFLLIKSWKKPKSIKKILQKVEKYAD